MKRSVAVTLIIFGLAVVVWGLRVAIFGSNPVMRIAGILNIAFGSLILLLTWGLTSDG